MRLQSLLLILALPLAARAGDSKLTVCLAPHVAIPGEVLMIASQELRQYTAVLKTQVELNCSPESDVRVTIESRPPLGMPEDALGAARTRNGRVLPNLRVFYDSVRELLPVRSPRLVARALALVIVHECFHFVRQELGHASHGAQAAFITGQDLERGAQWWVKQLETPSRQ